MLTVAQYLDLWRVRTTPCVTPYPLGELFLNEWMNYQQLQFANIYSAHIMCLASS